MCVSVILLLMGTKEGKWVSAIFFNCKFWFFGVADFEAKIMGKKRKHSETTQSVAQPKKEDAALERPARTLLGWKDKNQVEDNNSADSPIFRNKEKLLVTCSRRINYR